MHNAQIWKDMVTGRVDVDKSLIKVLTDLV